MSELGKASIFLERKSYRQRRLRDVVRLLPILGTVLWAIPLLWPQGEAFGISNASALQYLFGMWLVLIIISAVLSQLLEDDPSDTNQQDI